MEDELRANLERYREFIARAEASPEYWSAAAAYEFVRELERRMEEQGVSRAELARRLGSSKAYVTKVMSADANFTLTTLTRLAMALGGQVHVRIADPKKKARRQEAPQPEPGGGEESSPGQGARGKRSRP